MTVHELAATGDTDLIRRVVRGYSKYQLDSRDEQGRTCFHVAIGRALQCSFNKPQFNAYLATVRLLADAGADINIADRVRVLRVGHGHARVGGRKEVRWVKAVLTDGRRGLVGFRFPNF